MKKENCTFCKSQGYIFDTKKFLQKECDKCEGLGFFYVKIENKEKKEDVRPIIASGIERGGDNSFSDNLGEMERTIKSKSKGRPKKIK